MATTRNPEQEKLDTFFDALEQSLREGSFIECLLTKHRGEEPDLKRIIVRRIMLKNQAHLSFVYRHETRDITKNGPVEHGIHKIRSLLGTAFKGAHLFAATQDMQIELSKKGKVKLGISKPSRVPAAKAALEHDREKKRYVDSSRPFLRTLGITNANQRIVPAMARKWKQINKFVEIFDHAFSSSDLANKREIHVVDFGSGKGYLTFAIHDYLQSALGIKTKTTGVELRDHLVNLCTDLSVRLAMEGLTFRKGDVRSSPPERMDALIALHACDTATDLAIHLGIRSGAGIIMCSPCCHKEIRRQIKSPQILLPMLKYGVHMGQEADMVTDALRALLLEAHGYKTQILEFVSLEHTSKNKLILAVRGEAPASQAEIQVQVEAKANILAQIKGLKAYYGIEHQMLESLLEQSALPANT